MTTQMHGIQSRILGRAEVLKYTNCRLQFKVMSVREQGP